MDESTFESLRDRIERINALYADVEPGDRYSLTYAPGVGTELALNDAPHAFLDPRPFADRQNVVAGLQVINVEHGDGGGDFGLGVEWGVDVEVLGLRMGLDEQGSAALTFQRNALGNSVGDTIQPSTIAAAR